MLWLEQDFSAASQSGSLPIASSTARLIKETTLPISSIAKWARVRARAYFFASNSRSASPRRSVEFIIRAPIHSLIDAKDLSGGPPSASRFHPLPCLRRETALVRRFWVELTTS